MDAGVIITVATGVAAAAGGLLGGRRLGNSQAEQTAVTTVELLSLAVAELRAQVNAKDEELASLRGRISLLEGLVTQRAEVEAVHTVVEKIADRLGV